MRSVLFTIIGILAIGWALATLAPPHWVFGELFLLAACVLVVRDYLLTRDQGRRIAGTGTFIAMPQATAHGSLMHRWKTSRHSGLSSVGPLNGPAARRG